MSINIDKLFKAAKAENLTTFEAALSMEEKTSIQTFNGEVEVFTVAGNGAMKLRGVFDGKCGSFTSDRVDDEIIPAAVAAVKESAQYGQPIDPEFFVKGGEYEYEKVNTYNPELEKVSAEKLVEIAKELAKKAYALDKRINNVNTQVEYSHDTRRLKNSNGLDISAESNILVVVISGDAKDGELIESGFEYDFVTDFAKLDIDALAKRFVDYVVKQFGGETVKSGKYKVVYSADCAASLMGPLGGGFSAFNVEQHISLLEGKIGTQAFSELFTVREKSISDSPFARAFDAEGVPCVNKTLIDKGVPTGYVYDLATAKRAGVKSTGNGQMQGGNIRPAIGYCEVDPGDKSLEELFALVGDGLYITEISGIGTGLNPQSGSYSLQAAGYVIEKGKLSKPVSLITVASNVLDDFKNIIAVGNDSKLTFNGIKVPSIVVSEIAVSGK